MLSRAVKFTASRLRGLSDGTWIGNPTLHKVDPTRCLASTYEWPPIGLYYLLVDDIEILSIRRAPRRWINILRSVPASTVSHLRPGRINIIKTMLRYCCPVSAVGLHPFQLQIDVALCPSFISPLLNFSGYCIITLVVSIILCQYQFAQFTIWTLCIVWTLCTCSAIVIAFLLKAT